MLGVPLRSFVCGKFASSRRVSPAGGRSTDQNSTNHDSISPGSSLVQPRGLFVKARQRSTEQIPCNVDDEDDERHPYRYQNDVIF